MIDEDRIQAWSVRFRFYRDPPDPDKIRAWIALFEDDDRDLAAKVLDNVLLISERDIQAGYAAALAALPGWHTRPNSRRGKWRFLGFGRAGESGPAMLRLFREANDLASRPHDPLFVHLTDLPGEGLTAEDSVVFVDDFSGTGKQVCTMWPTIAELVASEAKVYLVLTAVTAAAVERIAAETGIELRYQRQLTGCDCVFAEACALFSEDEKEKLRLYGFIADPDRPEGFGASGLLLVLSHKTPNNSLPILHINEPRWRGLFPRYLRAAA